MKKRFLSIILIAVLLLLSACKNTTDQLPHQVGKDIPGEATKEPGLPHESPAVSPEKTPEPAVVFTEEQLNAAVSMNQWIDTLVAIYEDISGTEINIDRIIDMGTDAEKKAMEIDLLMSTELEFNGIDYPLTIDTAVDKAVKLHERVNRYLFSKAVQPATVNDALQALSQISQIISEDIVSEMVFSAVNDALELDAPLTRLNFAKLLVIIEENNTGSEIIFKHDAWKPLSDTDDIFAQKAESRYLTRAANDSFQPDKILQFREIYIPIQSMLSSIYWQSLDDDKPRYVTLRDLLRLQEKLPIWFDIDRKMPIKEHIVLNERPYQWYVNQYETGDYGYVNCMPASLEMAMKWRDEQNTVTAAKLREEYFCDGQGWYDVGLTNTMDRHNVPYTMEWDITVDSMIKHLDEGNILLVMYKDHYALDGHAVILKGYTKSEAGTWFISNDPGSFIVKNKYGVNGGIDRQIEGEELAAKIKTHALWYLVIPPK